GLILVVTATLQTVVRSLWHGIYRDAEALVAGFLALLRFHIVDLARPEIGIVLFLGGSLSAIVSNWAARRWG
ncbi:MAG TPA: hypothetical protein VGC31_02765, partial [Paenirhodobacter sp.]